VTTVPSVAPAAPADPKPVSTQGDAKKNPFGEITPQDLIVTQHDWDYLASAIHHIRVDTHGFAFFGAMLQSIMIDFSSRVPTACISFQPTKKQFLIELNLAFFRMLTLEERMAVLLHEVYHMTHNHLTRIPALQDRHLGNKAADAAINQIIPGIPTRKPIRCIFPEDFGLDRDKTMEFYYENWPKDEDEDDQQQNGQGQGQGKAKGKPQKGQPGQGPGEKGDVLDVHDWDPNVDESDVLDGMEDVVKRTMIKTNKSHSNLPKFIQDMLETIEKRRKCINWKQQLKMFLKRTTTGIDKEYTRSRPNRRYDYASPGMKLGDLPKVLILQDTSGSMSSIEVNATLDQVDEILKIGMRTVSIGLWHTGLYKVMKYKRGQRQAVHSKVQSGGTCFEECAEYINKMKPDAVIVMTDGYYSPTTIKVECPILFVITSGGVKQLVTDYPRQKMIALPHMGE